MVDHTLYTDKFVRKFAEEICCHIYCRKGDISGDNWEQIFASCIDVNWQKNNKFYDILDEKKCAAWSAKTVQFFNTKKQKKYVSLISGRNSTLQNYDISVDPKKDDPSHIGELILNIWNNRVLEVKKTFKYFKTIVLLRSSDLSRFIIFDYDTESYNASEYHWEWNKTGNLKAYDNDKNFTFLWQPKGTQFTISKKLPDKLLRVEINQPKTMSRELILENIQFNDNSYVSYYG